MARYHTRLLQAYSSNRALGHFHSTKEQSQSDATQAILFRWLRACCEKRDRLRLVIQYRRKCLDSRIRGGEEAAKRAEEDYASAKTQLVKLYHPDRFAQHPEKLETYEKLTAAINRAKDSGDIATLRAIAEDPQGFILNQGWQNLDFGEEAEVVQLRRLYETLQAEIVLALDSIERLEESPEYELWQLIQRRPGFLDEVVSERGKTIAIEVAQLQDEANRLAEEVEDLVGQPPIQII